MEKYLPHTYNWLISLIYKELLQFNKKQAIETNGPKKWTVNLQKNHINGSNQWEKS